MDIGSGLYVSEPIGGYFNSLLKGITVDGTNVYKGIVIKNGKKTLKE